MSSPSISRLRILASLCMGALVLAGTCFFPVLHAGGAGGVDVMLPVEQVLTSTTGIAPTEATFSYRMVALESGNPLPAGATGDTYTFTLDGSEAREIGPVTFNAPGLYTYRIEPVPSPRLPGMVSAQNTYTVTVQVHRDAGRLIADIIVRCERGEKVDTLLFETAYEVEPTDRALMVDPPVRKTVQGNPGAIAVFTFTLKALDPTQPMPVGSINGTKTVTVHGSGQTEFGTWSYTVPGVYYYTVAEVVSDAPGYTYDRRVYTITDTVTDEDGQLVLSRVVTNDVNQQVDAFTFINSYSPAGVTGGLPTVLGPLTGDFTNARAMRAMMLVSALVVAGSLFFLYRQYRRDTDAVTDV